MKFQKTLVAVAIAGIAAVPMVASADTTLSGVVEINLFGDDADDNELAVGVGDVLFGINAEHELNSGLTGYGNLRIDLDRLSNDGAEDLVNDPLDEEDDVTVGSAGTADAVFAGIKGGFGDFRIGEIPLAVEFGQKANDLFDVGAEINGGLSYTGNFGPVGIGLNYSPPGNDDGEDGSQDAITGAGIKFGLAGFSIGAGFEDRNELTNSAVGASFGFAGASVAAHFWSQEEGAGDGDLESVAIRVAYAIAGFDAALTFATQEDDGGTDEESVRLDVGYQLGGGTYASARVTTETDNVANDDLTSYRVQLAKSF